MLRVDKRAHRKLKNRRTKQREPRENWKSRAASIDQLAVTNYLSGNDVVGTREEVTGIIINRASLDKSVGFRRRRAEQREPEEGLG